MAKRNSSSEGGRRGASRPTSGKSFSGKGRSSDKSYKKSDSSSKSSYKKSDDNSDSRKKPFSSSSRGGSSDRPYKKFDKPFDKSSGDNSEKRTSRSYGSSRSENNPYKKFDKPYGAGSARKEGSSERPYKKFDKPLDRSSNKEDNAGEKRAPRSFGSSSRGERPYKKFDKPNEGSSRRESGASERPYKKFDKPLDRSSGKEEGSSEKRAPRSFGSSRAERPYKKFDKPFERPTGRNENASESPRRSSSEKPYKKFDKPRGESSGDDDSSKASRENSPGLPYKRAYEKGPVAEGENKTSESADFKSRSGRNRREKPSVVRNEDSDIIRLNKYIANSGMSSRREADEFIKMGLVSVNGTVITELGYKVKRGDEVRYEGKVLKSEKPVYILMNKPKGYITTTKDPQERNTVMHILAGAVKERVYPVGRLDRNTTGLLLLTNDGDLAERLMHPSYKAKKIYKVDLDRPLTKADFQKIIDGVYLEEGRAVVDDLAIISTDNKSIGIEIHIGWNRVVRRIFEALGYTVEKLDRSAYAGLDKKELPRGHWRYLKPEEVVLLKHMKK